MAFEFKDIKKCLRPHFVNMGKEDDRGNVITAMVHRNQIASFQRDGWIIPPSEGMVEIPEQEFTEDQLRANDAGEITLIEDSRLKDLASKNPAIRDHALAQAAIAESIKNPDPEKVEKFRRQYGKGSVTKRK